MAVTALTVLAIAPETPATFAPAAADTANGNSLDNSNGDVMLYVENTHATNSSTVTAVAQSTSKSVDGFGVLTKANLAIVVPALTKKILGPFPKSAFNDASNLVQLTYSGTGTINVQAFKSSGLQKV